MTTLDPNSILTLAGIRDRESLQLVSRLIESQRTLLEAQLVQTRQLQEAVQARLQDMK